jgi:hypothetical protein
VASEIAAAEVSLTMAQDLALIYAKLPRCGGKANVCSDQATVDKLKSLNRTAYTAVHAAMNNEALIADAFVAISTFSSAIPKS